MIKRFLNHVRRVSPNCREAARLMSQGAAGGLAWPDRVGLQIHLFICRACRNFRRSIQILGELMRASAQKTLESNVERLSEAAKARILRKLQP